MLQGKTKMLLYIHAESSVYSFSDSNKEASPIKWNKPDSYAMENFKTRILEGT